MALADRVLVYGDCAIIPEPTVDQLADIAVSSAATAAQFGVEPRIAMLSYSTGASGAGAEVDKVRAATELVRRRRPALLRPEERRVGEGCVSRCRSRGTTYTSKKKKTTK